MALLSSKAAWNSAAQSALPRHPACQLACLTARREAGLLQEINSRRSQSSQNRAAAGGGRTGVVQDALGGGGLAGVNVGHDTDVAVHAQGRLALACGSTDE
jgi:hypothetical protein